MFTDPTISHRGPVQTQGLLDGPPETPFMPLWQSVYRYVVEIFATVCLTIWAAIMADWTAATFTALGILVLLRVFNVRDDPATLDAPCITIPGIIRLILEWTLYALSFYAFLAISLHIGIPHRKILVCVYFGLVLLYYIVTYERVKWVLGQKDHPCKRRI